MTDALSAPGHSNLASWQDRVLADTQHWLMQAVIGLNLCPFAKAVVVKDLVRYRVTEAHEPEAVLALLREELLHLHTSDPQTLETTLLIAPRLLPDFEAFNQFLEDGDALLHDMGLAGELQVADFHPRYQFAGEPADGMSHFTNRAPYPTLHLLRETSIDRAVESYPDAAVIFERNIRVLNELGLDGWHALGIRGGD